MCWAERCCICFRLDLGGALIGLIVSTFFLAASVTLFCHDRQKQDNLLHLDMNQSSYDIILVMLIVISALGLVSSCLLIFGLWKNKPGFVLCYFGHGIVLEIVMLLSSLLQLLKMYWILALAQGVASMIFIHWLVVVHSIYELRLSGKLAGGSGGMEDEETLVDSLSDAFDAAIEPV